MIYFMEPFKSRTYNLLAADWSIETIYAEFDDAEFIHNEEQKAIYFYANFTKVHPEPSVKFRPEAFIWKPPVQAAIIFHYDEYELNYKEGDNWKKKKSQPGIVEKALCEYVINQAGYLGSPLEGVLDFSNSNMIRVGLSDELKRLNWLEQILPVTVLDAHNDSAFKCPAELGAPKKSAGRGGGGYSRASISESISQKQAVLNQFLIEYFALAPDSPSPAIIAALEKSKKANPESFAVLLDYLKLFM